MRYARFFVVFAFLVGGLLVFQPNVQSKGQGKGQSKKVTAPVPQTGQITCYDEIGQEVDCIGTGQDGEYQKGVPWPEPRFIDNEDGTITDRLTGLMWVQDALVTEGAADWFTALDICNNLEFAGYDDWRLPNIVEMSSLFDYGVCCPALPEGHPFLNISISGNFWSSTTALVYNVPPVRAWWVHARGRIDHHERWELKRFLPVRGGE
jgi:hypothetical protein